MADVRVAIADDDGATLDVLRLLFTAPGFQLVGMANHGDAVARLVRDTRPDVLVLDLDLPGTDGRALAPLVRAEHEATRIVLYSANDVQADDPIDVDLVVPKLASIQQLVDAVTQLARPSTGSEAG